MLVKINPSDQVRISNKSFNTAYSPQNVNNTLILCELKTFSEFSAAKVVDIVKMAVYNPSVTYIIRINYFYCEWYKNSEIY